MAVPVPGLGGATFQFVDFQFGFVSKQLFSCRLTRLILEFNTATDLSNYYLSITTIIEQQSHLAVCKQSQIKMPYTIHNQMGLANMFPWSFAATFMEILSCMILPKKYILGFNESVVCISDTIQRIYNFPCILKPNFCQRNSILCYSQKSFTDYPFTLL